jgi:hypothetical protein
VKSRRSRVRSSVTPPTVAPEVGVLAPETRVAVVLVMLVVAVGEELTSLASLVFFERSCRASAPSKVR